MIKGTVIYRQVVLNLIDEYRTLVYESLLREEDADSYETAHVYREQYLMFTDLLNDVSQIEGAK